MRFFYVLCIVLGVVLLACGTDTSTLAPTPTITLTPTTTTEFLPEVPMPTAMPTQTILICS